VHCGFWKTLLIVAVLRAPPSSPFALTNLVLAAIKTPRLVFALATALGMAPRTVGYIIIGTMAKELTKESMDKPWWLIVSMIVGTLIVIAVIGHIAKKAAAKVVETPAKEP